MPFRQQLGIDNCSGIGESLPQVMMVGDDHVDPPPGGGRHLGRARGARVDGEKEGPPAGRGELYRDDPDARRVLADSTRSEFDVFDRDGSPLGLFLADTARALADVQKAQEFFETVAPLLVKGRPEKF